MKTRAQLEKIFDRLYVRAEAIIKKYSPCEIKIVSGQAHCLDCKVRPDWTKPTSLCCGGCQFHTPKGCVAEKPLTCKLGLCSSASKKYPGVLKKLEQIHKIAFKYNFLVHRGDKKRSIDQAFSLFYC